ncbi:MAG TPA: trimethylamine methyltransferase family protein [Thermoleophilia bacterium]|nr:trimethylamine methyltransferase family protein [Thermoleophilia bacterium]HQG03253.1 trimethylamine methyltransferase family protein [Thermoleophilia bacterium]HQG54459.1 trimethylamine methyltransferase family protein [Thermoleophilia bacterium]HQJ98046.1 trimethylamine methyltransferase family protein [Thermoleophilia bacterium]
MRLTASWLSEDERHLIVEEAFGLLERTGMRFGSGRGLAVLAAAGADVDRDAGVARLPRSLVAEALRACPRDVLLGGATPAEDVLLDGARTHFVPSGAPTHVLDMDSGDYRPGTLRDQRESTIVADAMSVVDVMWMLVAATDTAETERPFRAYQTGLCWSDKHLQDEVTDRRQVEVLMRMMEVVCGDLDEFRRRPRVSVVCCTSSPLAIDRDFLDANLEAARHGTPIVIYPMPIAGGTAPITVAGAVAMDVAEFLGAATVIETAAPGTPVMLGAGASLLDMRAGTFAFGALESALMAAACAEVAHELGVPVLCPGLATDAKYGGIQAGYEKALKGLVAVSAGADLVTGGIGLLSGANLMSLPQIVIDAEIAAMILRLVDGAEVSPATVMAATIERLGFSGSYLNDKETARRLRAGEVFLPTIATRLSIEAWRARGRTEADDAADQVRAILAEAEARGPKLAADKAEALEDIVRGASAGS